jgi:hypothetical protein
MERIISILICKNRTRAAKTKVRAKEIVKKSARRATFFIFESLTWAYYECKRGAARVLRPHGEKLLIILGIIETVSLFIQYRRQWRNRIRAMPANSLSHNELGTPAKNRAMKKRKNNAFGMANLPGEGEFIISKLLITCV